MESLFEAFNDLADIDDGMLNVSINDVEKIKAFKEGDDVAIEYQKIIDPLAKDEEEVRGDYLGKKILKCCVCHSLVYKDEDEITFNEDETVANEGEECPMCFSTEGFKVVGEVSPFKDVTVEEDDERFELVKDITDLLTKFYRTFDKVGVEIEPLFNLETNGTLDLEKVREKLDEEPYLIKDELMTVLAVVEEGELKNLSTPEEIREIIKKVSELVVKDREEEEIKTEDETKEDGEEVKVEDEVKETELEESYTKKSHKEKSGKVIEESFKNEFERLEKVLKELNWSVEDIGDEYEIENWSPLGEDLIEYLDKKDIVESIRIIYDNYDVDEHAEPFIEMRGTRGVPNSIQALIEDAEDIQEMYKELKDAIEKEFGKDELEESLQESTERDDIDAEADDKKERIRKALKRRLDDADSLRDERRKLAKAKFRKAQDDIDADRDDKLERKGLKESKQLNEGYRGCKKVEMIWHGEWSDPELYYKDEDGKEYFANYYDVEDSIWNYYQEEAEYAKKNNDKYAKELNSKYDWSSLNEKDDTDFNKFVVDNENSVIEDVIEFSESNNYDHSEEIDESCKSVKESVTPRDDIDAEADNKKELAKKRFMRAKDDADADKDYRLKKANLKEPRKLKEENEEKIVVHLLPNNLQGSYANEYWNWTLDDDGLYGKNGDNGLVILDDRGGIYKNYTQVKDEDIETFLGNYEETLTALTGKKYKEFILKGYSQGDVFTCYYPEGEFSEEWLTKIGDEALGMVTIYRVPDAEDKELDTEIDDTIIIHNSGNGTDEKKIADKLGVSEKQITIKKPKMRWEYESCKKSKVGKELKESDKPAATSIEDAQKWVDYDMKKYGRISRETNRLVRRAGFQIIKDQYGDYEVTARDYERPEEELREDRHKNTKHYIEYMNGKEFDNGFFTDDEYNKLKKASNIKILKHKIGNPKTNKWEEKEAKEETLKEDTVKQGNYWVNKGEEGTLPESKRLEEDAKNIEIRYDVVLVYADTYKGENLYSYYDVFNNSRYVGDKKYFTNKESAIKQADRLYDKNKDNEGQELNYVVRELKVKPMIRVADKELDSKIIYNANKNSKLQLTEDTVKTRDGKWVNKGKEGTHGTFKTKKAADEQRRAIWVNWDK